MITTLPRREREVFEILCNAGEATALDVQKGMADPPSYSAVRTMLARLEAKKLVTHRSVGKTYIYKSVPRASTVRDSALRQMVRTFFAGSAAQAATALLGISEKLDPKEIEALQRAIDQAKERRP